MFALLISLSSSGVAQTVTDRGEPFNNVSSMPLLLMFCVVYDS
jgi:hypothetical protein